MGAALVTAVDVLMRGRAAAEALMLDACTITRPSGTTVDPETGEIIPNHATIYTGKCKVQSREGQASSPEAGEAAFTVVSRQVHIPAQAVEILDGDVVTVTASTLAPFLVGRKYRVAGWSPDSYDTADRLPVEETT